MMRSTPGPARRALALIIVVACSAAAVLSACSLGRHGDAHHVARAGGSAKSADGSLDVRFAPGQLTDDSTVTFHEGVTEAPAPVPFFAPIAQPISIDVDHATHGGTVTMSYALPSDVDATDALLVMMIEDHGRWRAVPTTTDPVHRTVTALWPHFSTSYLAKVDGLFDGVGNGLAWSWQKVKAGSSWLADESKRVAAAAGAAVVGLGGGTAHQASCTPPGHHWTFTDSTGMTGCAHDAEASGVWRAEVNDRFPYPLLVDLPDSVEGPGWTQLVGRVELPDLALEMIASRYGEAIIPAGVSMPFTFLDDSARVHLHGRIDPFSTAGRIVELVAIALSDGLVGEGIAEADAEVATLEAQLEASFLAARSSGSKAMGLADYIEMTQGDNGVVAMLKRAQSTTRHAAALDIVFDYIGLADCLIGTGRKMVDDRRSFSKVVKDAVGSLYDECMPQFIKGFIEHVMSNQLSLLDLTERAKQVGMLTKSLLADVKKVVSLTLTAVADAVSVLPGVDLTQADVTATPPGVDVVAAARDAFISFIKASGGAVNVVGQGDDWIKISYLGQSEKVTLTCSGSAFAVAKATAYCRFAPRSVPGLGAALRVPTGEAPTPEVLVLDGDAEQACGKAWALDVLLREDHGYVPPC